MSKIINKLKGFPFNDSQKKELIDIVTNANKKEEIFIEVVDMNVNGDGTPSGILICQDSVISKKIYDIVDSDNEVYVKYIDPVLGEVGINVPKGCHKTQSMSAGFMQYEGLGYSASIIRHIENVSDGNMNVKDNNIEIFITESFITISGQNILDLLAPNEIIFTIHDNNATNITLDTQIMLVNLFVIRNIAPRVTIKFGEMDNPSAIISGNASVVHCHDFGSYYDWWELHCTFFYNDYIYTIIYKDSSNPITITKKQLSFVE